MTVLSSMRRLRTAALLFALAGLGCGSVAEAQAPCLTTADAEAVTLVALPDILAETGRVCAARLPAASPLLHPDGSFQRRFQQEADRAWPAARAAIGHLSLDLAQPLLASDYARPLLTSLLVPLLVGRIAVADCPTIDRLVTQLAPLPPRNVAGVIVTTLGYLRQEKAAGKNVTIPDLPLCPTKAAR